MVLETIKDYILGEIKVIAGAPVSFVLASLGVVALAWAAVSWAKNSIIDQLNGQIQLQDRQLTDYKEKLNGATPSEAKARIDSLEARLSRIEPRRLSSEQRNIIASLVDVPYGVNYIISAQSDMPCGDCRQYLENFQDILNAAHWNIVQISLSNATAASPKGIAILTPDTNHPLPEASTLMTALLAAKIDFDLKTGLYSARDQSGKMISVAAILVTPKVAP
jgi:hypothetical protein